MRIKPRIYRYNRTWHRHFTWRSIKINCGYPHELGTTVWLEWVDRKYCGHEFGGVHQGHGLGRWHYQLPDSRLPTHEEALMVDPNYETRGLTEK